MSREINMFIIYAREDKDIKLRLLQHLAPFKNVFKLNIWHDDHIEPGQQWKPNIESRLNKTDIFLLLISIDFMNSEFINQVEFKTAIDRYKENKAIVIPVLIDYCQWDVDFYFDDYSFNMNELQVLPEQAKPIGEWKTSEQAFNNIAAGVRKVVASIKTTIEATELKKQKMKEHEENEEFYWQNCLQKNTIAEYNNYLQLYQKGKYSEEALKVIDNLQKIAEEESLWLNTLTTNSIYSFNHYLLTTKSGKHIEEAKQYISKIEESEPKQFETSTQENDNKEQEHENLPLFRSDRGENQNTLKKIIVISIASVLVIYGIWGIMSLRTDNSKNNSQKIPEELITDSTQNFVSTSNVLDSSLSIVTDASNILYVGIDNPLTINSKYAYQNTKVAIDNGKLISQSTKKIIAQPTKPGFAKITIDLDGKLQVFSFRVKNVPNPVAKVGNNRGGQMGVNEFKAQYGIKAELEDFIFENIKFNIVGFTLVLTGEGFPTLQYRQVYGDSFDHVRDLIEKAKKGTTVSIDEIKVSGPGGTRSLAPIVFNLR